MKSSYRGKWCHLWVKCTQTHRFRRTPLFPKFNYFGLWVRSPEQLLLQGPSSSLERSSEPIERSNLSHCLPTTFHFWPKMATSSLETLLSHPLWLRRTLVVSQIKTSFKDRSATTGNIQRMSCRLQKVIPVEPIQTYQSQGSLPRKGVCVSQITTLKGPQCFRMWTWVS